tara:strand:+ start:17206 stop:17475 length:270 start_codon:yes stop_codon:yes gene_type:complete
MIEIKQGSFKGNDTLEIHRDGQRVISFGKRKAQAIVEAIRDETALRCLEIFSGYAKADYEAKQAAAEAADRNKFDEAYCAAGMGEEVSQ